MLVVYGYSMCIVLCTLFYLYIYDKSLCIVMYYFYINDKPQRMMNIVHMYIRTTIIYIQYSCSFIDMGSLIYVKWIICALRNHGATIPVKSAPPKPFLLSKSCLIDYHYQLSTAKSRGYQKNSSY